MDENEKNAEKVLEGEVIDNNSKNGTIPEEKAFDRALNFTKKNKKILGLIIIIIIAFIIITNIIKVTPKEAVEGFIKNLNSANTEKAFEYFDWIGYSVYVDLDEDEYDNFYSEYEEALNDEESQSFIEDYKEELTEWYEEVNDSMSNSEIAFKIKRIVNTEKISKNFYLVTARIQYTDEDGESETDNYDFYVLKNGLKSYLVSDPYIY